MCLMGLCTKRLCLNRLVHQLADLMQKSGFTLGPQGSLVLSSAVSPRPQRGETAVHEDSENAKEVHERKSYLSPITPRIRSHFLGYGQHYQTHHNYERQSGELIPKGQH